MKDKNIIEHIADYCDTDIEFNSQTMETAYLVFKDSLGCMVKSLSNPQCQMMLGPMEPGNYKTNGIKVPGSSKELGLLDSAWNFGLLIRWLDYNDCFLAEEWGHPSDNLGGIIATACYRSNNGFSTTVQDVLIAMIKAHEIQGVLSLSNSLNKSGYDHVFFVKLATAAVATKMMGGTKKDIKNILSSVFIDAGPLRIYRHSPNVTTRKSWAAGDATMRGIQLSLITQKMSESYNNIIGTPEWGFNNVIMNGRTLSLSQELGDYVINNILFKAGSPAEFHAQTAAEAAMELHILYKDRLNDITSIEVNTHESAMRIIAHKTKLTNPSDRDHSLEYIIAVALLNGDMKTEYYYDDYHARHPEINQLINKMSVAENKSYSSDYLDPYKRSIPNAIQLNFNDGDVSKTIEVEYPIGHKFRREEVKPVLDQKFQDNLRSYYEEKRIKKLINEINSEKTLLATDITEFMNNWI